MEPIASKRASAEGRRLEVDFSRTPDPNQPSLARAKKGAEATRLPEAIAQAPSPSDRAELACPGLERYYRPRELDVAPAPASHIDRNPIELLSYANAGRIEASLCIDSNGKVVAFLVTASDLPAIFAASARRHFSAMAFRPGLRQGKPVQVRLPINIRYEPPPVDASIEKVPLEDMTPPPDLSRRSDSRAREN
jgi:hypothetical protein